MFELGKTNPPERFEDVGRSLAAWAQEVTSALTPSEWAIWIDDLLQDEFREAVERAEATEGSLWVRDSEEPCLVPVFNTGEQADQIVGSFRQPIGQGLVSMVYETGLPLLENAVHGNRQQDGTLDRLLGVMTCSMVAVPFGCGGRVRGVLTAVKLKPALEPDPDPPPFAPEALVVFERLAEVSRRVLEWRLVREGLGLGDS